MLTLFAHGCDPTRHSATFDAATPLLEAAFEIARTGTGGPFELGFSSNMSAAGANPSSLYAQALLGPWGEGDTHSRKHYMRDGQYALKSRDAVVSMLCTPPERESTYFSWETYVSERLSWPVMEWNQGQGAPISTLINAATLTSDTGYSPFNRSLILVTTADAATAAAVASAMERVAPAQTDVRVVTRTARISNSLCTRRSHTVSGRDRSVHRIYPCAL